MLTLLKNLDCYIPKYMGRNDILICSDKILKIQSKIADSELIEDIYDCEGLLAFPGFIDQHVHITGGGGEGGFPSHIPELNLRGILNAGVTTLVGLLGADGSTRSLEGLYAKAKALQADGITTYIYSGSYFVPPVTITGNIIRDLVFIDKVIGIGELALSDHRSSHCGIAELLRVSSEAHMGGLLSGKAGVMHLHIGDGKNGLSPLFWILEGSDLPIEQFVPTHVNRNPKLFEQAIDYCEIGGNIDLTAGETVGLPVAEAVLRLTEKKVDLSKVTISSDANGSIPGGGIGSMSSLYKDIASLVLGKSIPIETAASMVTENVAKLLKLYPNKGTLRIGSDADILITDENFQIKKLFGKGKLLLEIN